MPIVMQDFDLPGGGTPPTEVLITLWGAGQPIVGKQVSTGKYILGTKRIIPNGDGIWSADLVGNSDILPSGTSYQISYTFSCDTQSVYVSVPVTGGPFTPQDIEVDAMNSVAPPILDVHAANNLLHGGGIELDYAEITSSVVVTGTGPAFAAVPGLQITVPDVPRPVYVYARAPVQQTSGGPTEAAMGIHSAAVAPFLFLLLDFSTIAVNTTNPRMNYLMVKLPPHSGGDYVVTATGSSGNLTTMFAASTLSKAWIFAVAR